MSGRRRGRILCLTSNFPRWTGDSTTPFVLHLARDLQELGWRVDVLAPHAPGTATREILDGVQVERFRYLWPARLETVCYRGGALINLRRHPSNALKLPALVLAEWAASLRRLAGRRYDLLHSHWILPQGFTGALAAWPLGVPHVLSVHGGDVFALRGRWLTHCKRFALHRADAVTVNSSVTGQAVQAIAGMRPQLQRIPMGVTVAPVARDDPRVQRLRQQHRRGDGPLLVFVGRLVEEKGVADLLHALGVLLPELPEASALVVGEGQDRPALEALARQLGVAQRVVFSGWVAPEEVGCYLAAGDVFVGPSRRGRDGWVEAQGLSFIEAMIAGTPVVATRVGGIIDSVRDGETGLLVPERSPGAIAAAVRRLVADPALVARLRRQGYALATTAFSRPASAAAFDRLFEQLRGRRLAANPRPLE